MPTTAKTTKKTKQDLLDEIAELKNQIANMEKYQMYKNMSDEMKMVYDAYKESGFTEDQAFTLLTFSIKYAAHMGRR